MYGSTSTSRPWKTAASRGGQQEQQDSIALIGETEAIGRETLGKMYDQRAQLEHSHAQVESMKDMTNLTHLTLEQMRRKAMSKLLCLYFTIAFLSILIILVLYREITNHGRLF
jgi:hypothetical protein